jgi:hypothetical protein
MHSETFSTAPNAPADPHSDGSEKPMDAASNVRHGASNPQRSVADKIDANRDGAAAGLENGGTSLHAKAQSLPGGPRVARTAHAAANTLSRTAEYIRKHDAAGMMADAKRVVKDNPAFALLGAAIIGFALARMWSRD